MDVFELEKRHNGHHHGVHMFYGNMLMISYLIGLCFMVIKNVLNPSLKKKFGFSIHPPGWIYAIIWLFLTVVFVYYRAVWPLGFVKRVGRISASMLPLTVLFSLRPSPLPRTYYLNLVEFHKWVSRTLVFLGTFHGIMYWTLYVTKNLGSKVWEPQNFAGVVLMVLWLLMLVSSLRPIRIRWYRWFYWLHYIPAWLTIPLILYHARPNVYIVVGSVIVFMVSQIIWRIYSSRHIKNSLEVQNISPTLQIVTFPRSYLPQTFPVGTHIRVSKSLWNPLTWLSPTHPYTVASLASDAQAKLLIRKTRFPIVSGTKYSILGPFKSPLEAEMVHAKKVLFFAGGAGISLAAPLLRFLELKKGRKLKLVWITRDAKDMKAIDALNLDTSIIDVYITGGGSYGDTREPGVAEYSTLPNSEEGSGSNSNSSNAFAIDEEEALELDELLSQGDSADELDNELLERQNTVNSDEHDSLYQGTLTSTSGAGASKADKSNKNVNDDDFDEDDLDGDLEFPLETSASTNSTVVGALNGLSRKKKTPDTNVKYGRPDISSLTEDFMDMHDHGNIQTFVVACGPRSLVNDVSALCSRKRYQIFTERYST